MASDRAGRVGHESCNRQWVLDMKLSHVGSASRRRVKKPGCFCFPISTILRSGSSMTRSAMGNADTSMPIAVVHSNTATVPACQLTAALGVGAGTTACGGVGARAGGVGGVWVAGWAPSFRTAVQLRNVTHSSKSTRLH